MPSMHVPSAPSYPCRQEPTEPYLIIKDPQAYLDPKRLYSPRPGMQR